MSCEAYHMLVALNLKNQLCLVIGGGRVAERKVRVLLDCAARVRVVSPEVTPWLAERAAEGKIEVINRTFREDDVLDPVLIIIATSDPVANRLATSACYRYGKLINNAADPAEGNCFFPAVVRRGPLAIAVTTGGCSPLFARLLKEEIAVRYGPEYGEFVAWLGHLRAQIISEVSEPQVRNAMLSRLVDEGVMHLLERGEWEKARERVLDACNAGGLKS